MRQLLDTGNLRISWKTYYHPRFFYYKKYHIHDGYDYFLFIGPLEFRWWIAA